MNQKYYADKYRREHHFKVGDKVYIDASHFKLQSGSHKLNPVNLGPFEIIKSKLDLKKQIDSYKKAS